MKSPLNTGLLNPMRVPEAEPPINVYWVLVALRSNNDEVADSLTRLAIVSLAEEDVAPMPT